VRKLVCRWADCERAPERTPPGKAG